MRLIFESDGKKLEMGDDCDASVIEISGLGTPERQYNTKRYVNIPGQVTVSSHVLARNIVIKGDICLNGGLPTEKYHTFFCQSGMLTITGKDKKNINYNPVSFKTGNRNGEFVSFELKLVCDFPYFSDGNDIPYEIYKRLDMVTGKFSLPKVFTKRVTEVDIYNSGQADSEPVITIGCTNQGIYSGGIVIYNALTKKELKLDTNLSLGETITIDIKNRKISSNKRANCYGILNENCVLSDFVIARGINHILLTNLNDGETVTASILFNNLYAEAEIVERN